MRVTLLLLMLVASSCVAAGQTNSRLMLSDIVSERAARVPDARQCARESLSLKEGDGDAAMGGVRATDYVITNTSSSPCTLNGYPRVELMNRQGLIQKRAANSDQLPDDNEKLPPRLVLLEPGKTAWFRVYFNAGGAGHVGKPCPTYPRSKITLPGVTRAFVLRSEIQSCRGTDFRVSSLRSGMPQ